jgi:hypothetical protein
MAALGGESLRDARILAGYLDRAEFAALVGVSPRTLEGWEAKKGRVPDGKEALVRKVLAERSGPDSLDHVSNMDLLSALAARLAYYEERDRRLTELEREMGRDDDPDPVYKESGQDSLSSEQSSGTTRRNPVTGVTGPTIRRRPQ